MKFHATFTYKPIEREKLIHFLHGGALTTDGPLKVKGAWIGVQTGIGYALLEATDAKALYDLCSNWSEYGQVSVTPVIAASEL